MTLSFQAKEKNDGYQHVQILVNETSNHDEVIIISYHIPIPTPCGAPWESSAP